MNLLNKARELFMKEKYMEVNWLSGYFLSHFKTVNSHFPLCCVFIKDKTCHLNIQCPTILDPCPFHPMTCLLV